MASNTQHLPAPATLPADGLSRWAQAKPYIPMSKERWRQLGNEGRAPQPIRLGIRCTMYSNREIHRWLADPVNYRADAA